MSHPLTRTNTVQPDNPVVFSPSVLDYGINSMSCSCTKLMAVIFSDIYYRKCRNEKSSKHLETKESMEAQEAFD